MGNSCKSRKRNDESLEGEKQNLKIDALSAKVSPHIMEIWCLLLCLKPGFELGLVQVVLQEKLLNIERSRVEALRWELLISKDVGVDRQEKIAGKWKDRSLPVLASLLNESVCLAAARWQPNLHGQTEQRDAPEHAASVTAKHDAPSDGE